MNFQYSATANGKTVSRKSAHAYTHGVVAVFPDGAVRLISCHADRPAAVAASFRTDGTAARFQASQAGATFQVEPLTVQS